MEIFTDVINFYSEPEPNPPHYTRVQVEATMAHILRLFQKNGIAGSTLLSILSQRPVCMSRILLRIIFLSA